MPLPAGVDGVTVSSGKPLCLPDGTPYEGKILFIGPDVVTVDAQDVVLGGTTEAKLVGGQFSVTLAATDVAGMSPSGWTYRVIGVFSNAPGWIRYISLPKANPTVALADVIVPDSSAGTFTVLADPTTLLAKSANLSDLASPTTARTNLGLGTAATRNVGVTTGTVAAGDDSRLSDARTPTPHASSHGSGGTDAVTVAQSQVTGLAAALALLLAKAGGTMTGDLTVNGANLMVSRTDGTGAYRLRVTGGGLDFEIGGLDVIISVWSSAGFTGTQSNIQRWESNGTHLLKRTVFGTGGFDEVHVLDATTGVAELGSKNGLGRLRLAGFKNSAGAPGTGAWTAGDVVLDSAGAWHLCTAGGSPGTWT